MKHIKIVMILAVIIIAGAIIWAASERPNIDSGDKLNTNLYEQAVGVWDSELKVSNFRPQIINDVEFGSSTMVTVTWSPPQDAYNHFVLTITDPTSTFSRKESGEHDRFSLDPDRLSPNTEYTFALQACLDPKCESWYISQSEVIGAPSRMYWQIDGQGSTETFVADIYQKGEKDTQPDESFTLNSDNTILYWPDGSIFSDENTAEYLNNYDQDLIFMKGRDYEKRIIFNKLSETGEAPEPFASATLLNP